MRSPSTGKWRLPLTVVSVGIIGFTSDNVMLIFDISFFLIALVQANYADDTWKLVIDQRPAKRPDMFYVNKIKKEASFACVKLLHKHEWTLHENNLFKCSDFRGSANDYQIRSLKLILDQKTNNFYAFNYITRHIKSETGYECLKRVKEGDFMINTDFIEQCGNLNRKSAYSLAVVDLIVKQSPCKMVIPHVYINKIRNEHAYHCVKVLYDANIWITWYALEQCSKIRSGPPLPAPSNVPPCQKQQTCPVSSGSSSTSSTKQTCSPSESNLKTDNRLKAFFSRLFKGRKQ